MKKINLLLVAFVLSLGLNAQKWTEMMRDTNANFYDIVKEFDNYWKDKKIEKGKGYKAFKRWQWFAEPRVYPSGNMKYASRLYALEQLNKEESQKKKKSGSNNTINAITANWVPLGPFGSPVGGDAGRVQSIRVHPAGTNTFYVGTAAGGFWITHNGGVSYTTTTDQLGSCGVSDIAVNPINPSVIYISTGDKDGDDTHSTGVLKSTNGGFTWANTGLLWQTSQLRRIYRLLINPLNPNTLMVASTVGMYRSLDAGVTWSLVSSGSYVDAEYKPGDTTVIYAVSNGGFVRSTNGGSSFSNVFISSSFTSNRLSLAVTPANNNYVYILASATDNSFGGLYRSVDGAGTFSLMSTTPNIFDWSPNGSGSGGQGWYDIAIDASPANADEIIAGGVNTWKSTDGGANWNLHTYWTGGGSSYVHADLHHVLYVTGSIIFLGTDGGVARTTSGGGLGYNTINGNMNIAQIYKLGLSASTPSLIITGHQDNGSNVMNGTTWTEVYGGDGMDCFISWNNNNTMVCSYVNGDFYRSTNGGNNWTSITSGLTGNGAWVAPIVQDATSPNTFYCGYNQVYKSTNQGSSWTQLGNIGASLDEIKVAPSSTNIIYATAIGGIWKTSNGGSTWSNITGIVLAAGGKITDLAVNDQNPNIIFATVSGYSAGNKVFASYDGGGSWTNYSAGLPNIPVNCIVYKNNSPHALYVGTDVGVYYREGNMSSWIPYSGGLPNIVVSDLEIYYPTGKLRAATYARGVWETDIYSNPGALSTAAFYSDSSPACINTPVQLNDLSSNSPVSWQWSFSGGNPATSSVQNPIVTYPAVGVYTISLITTNSVGASPAYVTTISVVGPPTVAPVSASVCVGSSANFSVTTNATVVKWSNGQQGNSIIVSSAVNAVYNYTAYLGACSAVGTASLFVDPVPPTPVIVVMPGYLTTTVTGVSYQWYKSGTLISGATSATYAPTQDGYYSIWVSIGSCFSSSAYEHFIVETTGIKQVSEHLAQISIRPNPVNDELTVLFKKENTNAVEYEVVNSIGQIILNAEQKSTDVEFKVNTASLQQGVYYLYVKENGVKTAFRFIKQ